MIEQADMAKLLGRSLTATETDNYELYLNIATDRLEQLLCISLLYADEERTFESRLDYRTVYVDPFHEITSVSIDGETVDEDDYVIKQNNRFSGDWYNIIEFAKKRRGENIVVDANWGFATVPYDLQSLLAKLFAQVGVEQKSDNSVKSKKIEDFTVTYKDGDTYSELVADNQATISKYAQCEKAIRHGAVYVRPIRY